MMERRVWSALTAASPARHLGGVERGLARGLGAAERLFVLALELLDHVEQACRPHCAPPCRPPSFR
jgi:hypothetical protein